jgi:hypothetical protein
MIGLILRIDESGEWLRVHFSKIQKIAVAIPPVLGQEDCVGSSFGVCNPLILPCPRERIPRLASPSSRKRQT